MRSRPITYWGTNSTRVLPRPNLHGEDISPRGLNACAFAIVLYTVGYATRSSLYLPYVCNWVRIIFGITWDTCWGIPPPEPYIFGKFPSWWFKSTRTRNAVINYFRDNRRRTGFREAHIPTTCVLGSSVWYPGGIQSEILSYFYRWFEVSFISTCLFVCFCSFSNCNCCMMRWLSSNKEYDSLPSSSPFSISP